MFSWLREGSRGIYCNSNQRPSWCGQFTAFGFEVKPGVGGEVEKCSLAKWRAPGHCTRYTQASSILPKPPESLGGPRAPPVPASHPSHPFPAAWPHLPALPAACPCPECGVGRGKGTPTVRGWPGLAAPSGCERAASIPALPLPRRCGGASGCCRTPAMCCCCC